MSLRPVLLIALNFVRMQWVTVLIMGFYLVSIAALFAYNEQRQEVSFFFQSHAFYVLFLGSMLAIPAIQTERKSRRILAVLSKGVGRQQYLSGLVGGVTIACTIYCVALGITGSWTLGEAGFSVQQVWFLMLYLVAASMLAGTTALMFSTFLNPFFAAGATAIVLGLPALAAHVGARWEYVIPVYSLSAAVLKSSFKAAGSPLWFPLGLAVLETIVFWVLAARIFSRMDIAVSVE